MSTKEEWRPIKGYEGYYEVSSHGRVRSCNRIIKRKNGTFQHFLPKVLKLQTAKNGYAKIMLQTNGKKRLFLVHRLVATSFIPNKSNSPQVNHIDGNKLNNRANNLEWCSLSENHIHAFATGLRKNNSGADNCCAKLTWEQIKEIRKSHKLGDKRYGTKALAKKYGIAPKTVYNIVRYHTYKDY